MRRGVEVEGMEGWVKPVREGFVGKEFRETVELDGRGEEGRASRKRGGPTSGRSAAVAHDSADRRTKA